MRKYPLIFLLSFAFIAITAFAVSDNSSIKEQRFVAEADLLDQLTDELTYLVQLSDAAGKRFVEHSYLDLSREIQADFMTQNRILCSLIIDREVSAKRELQERHQQGVARLIISHHDQLSEAFDRLLLEEFQVIDSLIQPQLAMTDDPELQQFFQQLIDYNDTYTRQVMLMAGDDVAAQL